MSFSRLFALAAVTLALVSSTASAQLFRRSSCPPGGCPTPMQYAPPAQYVYPAATVTATATCTPAACPTPTAAPVQAGPVMEKKAEFVQVGSVWHFRPATSAATCSTTTCCTTTTAATCPVTGCSTPAAAQAPIMQATFSAQATTYAECQGTAARPRILSRVFGGRKGCNGGGCN